MSYNLEKYSKNDLIEMSNKMDLQPKKTKKDMISDITEAFDEYKEYHCNKVLKYDKHYQLGNKGKEGTTYLVTDQKNNKFAMKTFRKTKASSTLKTEYKLQKRSSKFGISPCVYEYDTISKYIVMDILDGGHLLDILKKQKGTLLRYQQKRILFIYKQLDKAGVFHGDANLTNYMMKGKDIYIIDYGFSKPIDEKLIKKLGTSTPNMDLMLLGFVLKLKELKCSSSSYKYLLPHISLENREKFQL
jgi:tRNA A-37 threonylcarbamoyl transferase component Bud32